MRAAPWLAGVVASALVVGASCIGNPGVGGGAPQCCHEDADCMDGWACTEGVCSARCTSTDQCGVGETCQARSNSCVVEGRANPCAPTGFESDGSPVVRPDAAIADGGGRDVPIVRRDASSLDRWVEEPDGSAADGGEDAGGSSDGGGLDGGGRDGAGGTDGAAPDSGGPDAAVPDAGPTCEPGDAFEPNDSAQQAAAPFAREWDGASCDNDEDWFTLGTVTGDSVTVVVDASSAAAMRVQLVSANGGVLATATSPGNGTWTLFGSGVPGVTRLVVTTAAASTVDYHVAVSIVPANTCLPDAHEPNDTVQAARLLDAAVAARICGGDVDHFRVDVRDAGSTVTVDLVPAPTAGNLDVDLLDALNGQVLAMGRQPSGAERVTLVVGSAGPLVVRVFGARSPNGNTGDYSLSVAVEPPAPACQDDSFEPNDATTAARQLTSDAIGAQLCPADPDHYLVNTQGQSTTLQVVADSAFSFRLAASTSTGMSLGAVMATNGQATLSVGSGLGIITVSITGTPPSAGAPYRLIVTRAAMCTGADAFEPNDTVGTAKDYVSPAVAGVSCNGELDHFRVASLAGETVTALVTGAVDVLQLVSATGAVLADGVTIPGGMGLRLDAVPGGVVVRVSARGATAVSYSLAVDRSSTTMCIPDNYEPNDSRNAARVAPDLLLARVCNGDVDFFSVPDVVVGDTLQVDLFPEPSAGDLQLELQDPSGRVMASSTNPGGVPETVSVMPAVAGTWFVRVFGAASSAGSATGDYALQVTHGGTMACVDDGFEENDAPNSASPFNGAADAVLCPSDPDFYVTNVPQGGGTVVVSTLPGVQVTLAVATFGGQVVGTDTDVDGDLRVDAAVSGPVLVVLQAFNVPADGLPYSVFVEGGQACSGDDAHEPNDSMGRAAALTDPFVEGAVCAGDEDWFRVASNAGDTVTVTVFATGSGQADVVEIVDAGGNVLAQGQPGTDPLVAAAVVGGQVFVRVAGFGMTTARYQLEVLVDTNPACINDNLEPNNTQPTARLLNGQANAVICPLDVDFHAVDVVQSGSTIVMSLVPAPGTGDLDVVLLDPFGMEMGRSELPAGQAENITVTAANPGRYVFRVYGWPEGDPAGGTGGYFIQATVQPGMTTCVDDGFEPNDSLMQPARMTTDVLNATLCPGDPDVFSLGRTTDGQLGLTWTDNATLVLEVFSANGAPLARVSGGGGSLVVTLAAGTGPWLVQVTATSGSGTGTAYTLRWGPMMSCTGADTQEPNNTLTGARPYSSPSVSGIVCGTDEDWFSVPSTAGDTVTATVGLTGGNAELFITDGNGVVLATGMAVPGGLGAAATNVAGGTWVRIRTSSPSAVNFTLSVNRVNPNTCVPDNFEPNETPGTARLYAGPTQAQICAGDRDFFAFDAVVGTQAQLQVFPLPGAGDIDLRLRAPDGTVLRTSNQAAGVPENISLVLMRGGRFTVEIYGVPEGSTSAGQAPYLLTITLTPPTPTCMDDGMEENDSFGAATPLPGLPVDLPAVLCNSDRDFYGFFMPQAGTLTLSLQYAPPPRIRVTVFNSAQQQVGDATGLETGALTIANLPPDFYVVRVLPTTTTATPLDYVLHVESSGTTPACMGDAFEPNDDPSTATPLFDGQSLDASICGTDDLDVFAFRAGGPTSASFTLSTQQHPFGPVDLVVFDATGMNQLGDTFGLPGPDKVLNVTLPTSGVYWLVVFNSAGLAEEIPYTLKASGAVSTCMDDGLEDNDTITTATPEAAGATIAATSCAGDEDWYGYSLFRAFNYRVDLRALAPNGGVVEVISESGMLVATGNANTPLTFRPPQRGRYFLRVTFAAPPATGQPYTLMVTRL